MLEKINEWFDEWVSTYLPKINFGDTDHYQTYGRQISSGDRSTLNAYLITEGDAKVKFGGFLDHRVRDFSAETGERLSVHSEVKVYSKNSLSADLSIHKVDVEGLYFTSERLRESAVAVIEIKFATFREPYAILPGAIADIRKLSELVSGGRFLLLLDESLRLDRPLRAKQCQQLQQLRDLANEHGVRILSNNRHLTRCSEI